MRVCTPLNWYSLYAAGWPGSTFEPPWGLQHVTASIIFLFRLSYGSLKYYQVGFSWQSPKSFRNQCQNIHEIQDFLIHTSCDKGFQNIYLLFHLVDCLMPRQ